jgi:geranylgeranyl pyrophosphate synthase
VTSTTDWAGFLAATRSAVEPVLAAWGDRARERYAGPVGEAIAYSLDSPGKRFRPALVVAGYGAFGGRGDAIELAAAVEVVHTYSLVHDDLPCMDDDDLRRGRPTTHRAFDVPTAMEAGFQMVPLSLDVLMSGTERLGLPVERVSRIGVELYQAAGAAGMIRGQVLDLEAEGKAITLEELIDLHRAKTGALIAASVAIGGLAAGADDEAVAALRRYGSDVGLAFQIVDDVLDATMTSDELGKTPGKDAEQHKANFVAALGVDGAGAEARRYATQAVDQLRDLPVDSGLLEEVADFVVSRRS